MAKILDFFSGAEMEGSTQSDPILGGSDYDSHYFHAPEGTEVTDLGIIHLTGDVHTDISRMMDHLLVVMLHYSGADSVPPAFTSIGKAMYGFADSVEHKQTEFTDYLDKISEL